MDRHPAEHATALGRLADAHLDDLVRAAVVDPLAAELDLALAGAELAGDRPQRRRLAGPVRADERDDLALVDRERDAAQGMDRAVVGVDVVELEECHRQDADAAPRPR